MHPLRGLCHDGGHSLSEPLHLFPQGPQTLSPIEEIKHGHHGARVCLWEGAMLQLGTTCKALHATLAAPMPPVPCRTGGPSPTPLPSPAPAPEEPGRPSGAAFSSARFLPSHRDASNARPHPGVPGQTSLM